MCAIIFNYNVATRFCSKANERLQYSYCDITCGKCRRRVLKCSPPVRLLEPSWIVWKQMIKLDTAESDILLFSSFSKPRSDITQHATKPLSDITGGNLPDIYIYCVNNYPLHFRIQLNSIIPCLFIFYTFLTVSASSIALGLVMSASPSFWSRLYCHCLVNCFDILWRQSLFTDDESYWL